MTKKLYVIRTNKPVLQRICRLLNSGKFILPFNAKPGEGHVERIYRDYDAGEVWDTIIFNDWQYLTPRDNMLLNTVEKDISDEDLYKITNILNNNILNLGTMTYKDTINKYTELMDIIEQANNEVHEKRF